MHADLDTASFKVIGDVKLLYSVKACSIGGNEEIMRFNNCIPYDLKKENV